MIIRHCLTLFFAGCNTLDVIGRSDGAVSCIVGGEMRISEKQQDAIVQNRGDL